MSGREEPGAAHRRLTYKRDGFAPVTCLVADLLRGHDLVRPESSKTDLSGEYGDPEVYTSWAFESGTIVLHEHRWPSPHSGQMDPFVCEHYAATIGDAS